MDLKSWGQHLLFDTKLDMIQLIIYDETFWVSCSRKSQKGFYKNPAPKIAIKAAFPAPEIAKICQFKAPKWAKKALLVFRRRKSPKRGDFRRRKSPFSSRDPLWIELTAPTATIQGCITIYFYAANIYPWYLVCLSHWAGLPCMQVLYEQVSFSKMEVPAGDQVFSSRQQLPEV